MTGQIKWGVIAPGGIAQIQVADMQLAGLNIHAVASRTLGKAQEFAKNFNIPSAYGSYAELLEASEVDVVYVSATQNAHLEIALQVIESGVHLLLEKPFTLNAKQAQQIADAAKARGVFVMEAMWTRFLPSMDAIFEVINSGQIGDVRFVTGDHSQYLPETFAKRLWQPELGGGALLDLGIYPISFFSRVFGTPEKITAQATLTDLGVDLMTSAVFSYAGGAQASMTTSMEVFGPITASVAGTRGRIDIDTSFYEQTSFTVYETDLSRESGVQSEVSRYEAKIEGRGMQYQALEVERCVRAGLTESPKMSLDETVSIMETMDEIRKQTGVKYPGE